MTVIQTDRVSWNMKPERSDLSEKSKNNKSSIDCTRMGKDWEEVELKKVGN